MAPHRRMLSLRFLLQGQSVYRRTPRLLSLVSLAFQRFRILYQSPASVLSRGLQCLALASRATAGPSAMLLFLCLGRGLMAASVLTLYSNNPIQAGSAAGLLTLTQPGASTSTTGWTVAKIAPPSYATMFYNSESASGNFDGTAKPNAAPASSAIDSWRISAATTGDFSAGTWYSSLSVIAVTSGGDQEGRARIRVWRSVNADGTTATEITKSTMIGTTITNLATTVAQSSSASTQVAAFSLSNEYLFLQCAWEITGAGGANTRDVLVRLGSLTATNGSGLVTSAFSATAAAAVAIGAGLFNEYYKQLVQDMV